MEKLNYEKDVKKPQFEILWSEIVWWAKFITEKQGGAIRFTCAEKERKNEGIQSSLHKD